jgi:hypothetical protein
MPQWVRVQAKGVGKWTQSAAAPLPEGAEIIDEPATDGAGHPLVGEPDPPTDEAALPHVTFAAYDADAVAANLKAQEKAAAKKTTTSTTKGA